jgi:hypothetical protein
LLDHQQTNLENLAAGRSATPISYGDALENYRRNTDWWVVFAAFDLPDLDPSPLWIAQKTNLSVDVVVEALEGLAVLGFLKKDRGAFFPVPGKDFVNFDVKNKPKADVIDEHAVITRQVLNQLNDEAIIAIDHRCFASDVEILNELYSDMRKAFEKAYTKSKSLKTKDRIFKMTFTAVDVLKGKGK